MLEKLRKRLGQITTRLQELQAKDELTAEEIAEIERLTAEHATVSGQITTLERAQAATAVSAQPTGTGRRSEANGTGAAGTAAAIAAAAAITASGITGVQDRVFQDPMRGFRGYADFAMAVMHASRPGGQFDQRLDVVRREQDANRMPNQVQVGAVTYLNEGSAADSGWAVPPQMRDGIWEVAYGGDDIVNMVGWEPTSTNSVEFEADESTPWATNGVVAKWRNEAETMTATKPQAPQPRVLRVNELYAFIQATEELLDDAPRLESRLIQKAGRAINWTASESLINGNGVGKPLGWMQSPALISVAKEAGQAIGSVVLNNLTKAFTRVALFGGRLRWLANQDVLPALVPMTLGNYPLYIPVGGGASPVQGSLNTGTLLGLPLSWNPHCKSVGNIGDLQLVNLDGYYALRRGDIKYATSIHLYFDTAKTAFRWTFRFGGMPFLSAPISVANGTNTQSHFVAIADRTS